MSVEVSQMPCRECQKRTKHERQVKDVSHLLHFFLSLFTLGVWVIAWILIAMFPDKGPWRCSVCGTKAKLRDRWKKS